MNIILVEDSSVIRHVLLRYLSEVPGARVVGEAAGEAEAIDMITELAPDLVLLDLSLAPGSGVNVLRQVRADGYRGEIWVMTHQPLEAYRLRCEALGADGFYDKGDDMDRVLSRIRSAIVEV